MSAANSDNLPFKVSDIAESLQLLTRLPVSNDSHRGGASAWAWPLAGLVLALVVGIVSKILLAAGLAPMVVATLALITVTLATGAMHEDGLADCADGFWGSNDPEKRLEIMKDSAIGTYGTLALAGIFVLKWSTLSALFAQGYVLGPLVAAWCLSRAAMAANMTMLENARGSGLSDSVGRPDWKPASSALVIAMIAALLFLGFPAILATLFAAAAAASVAAIARTKIGGQTGDVLGATQQTSEAAALIAAAWLLA